MLRFFVFAKRRLQSERAPLATAGTLQASVIRSSDLKRYVTRKTEPKPLVEKVHDGFGVEKKGAGT